MSILDEMVNLNKKFGELYRLGLIGINYGQVQITLDDFLNTFDEYEVDIDYITKYPYRFYTIYKGVEFVAVADRDDLERFSK